VPEPVQAGVGDVGGVAQGSEPVAEVARVQAVVMLGVGGEQPRSDGLCRASLPVRDQVVP
jgi:hypothetical protein